MTVASPPYLPFIVEFVGATVTPTIASLNQGPATWCQVIGAGTVVLVNEAGNSVSLVCGGGEVFVGSFTSITSSTATRVRMGNGLPPVSAPGGVNSYAVNLAGGSASVTGILPIGNAALWVTAVGQSAAFGATIDTLYTMNIVNTATAMTLPDISASNDGRRIGLYNSGTTTTVVTAGANDAIAAGSSAGTAAGPAAGLMKTYTASLLLHRWLVQ